MTEAAEATTKVKEKKEVKERKKKKTSGFKPGQGLLSTDVPTSGAVSKGAKTDDAAPMAAQIRCPRHVCDRSRRAIAARLAEGTDEIELAPWHARSAHAGELWPALLHKALGKFAGSYTACDRWTLEDIVVACQPLYLGLACSDGTVMILMVR